MEPEFWHERWAKNEIGFHLKDVNPFLLKHWSALQSSSSDSVFVPLCGKSVDLIWLSKQCASVVGIELNQQAVEAFFSEHHLTPEITQSEHLTLYQAGNITLYCGDIFQLRKGDVENCSLIYDRASLVAFPSEMRRLYSAKLDELFNTPHKRLLIAFDYDQQLMNGPPFAVSPEEVDTLFGQDKQITHLETASVLEQNKRFKERGITALLEHVFIVEKR